MEKNKLTASNKVTESEFRRIANRVSFITILQNALLSIFKLLAGIFANSNAMISDAIHSASDVFSTIVVIIGVKLASKDSDKEHPYGHERLECVAAIVLAMVLLFTGLKIGAQAVKDIVSGNYGGLEVPGVLALVAAVISIITKEVLGIDLLQTRIFGNKIYVDVEIQANASYTLQEAHQIAEEVHENIEQNFPKVKHVMVHVNPAK